MKKIASLVAVATLSMASAAAFANDCPVSHAQLQTALDTAVSVDNGGLNYDMWGTVVNRDGAVCAVVKSINAATSNSVADPWPGSRVISAQKANTANAFSNAQLSLSTANLYSAVQPGGSLFGLQHSNPVDVRAAYRGNSANNGAANDPMNGLKIGGVNVFGGGLALYDASTGELVGAVGVSGDTSCADHNVAMRTRDELGYDWGLAASIGGIDADGTDNIVYNDNIGAGLEAAFNQPQCGFGEEAVNDTIMTGLLPST